MTSSPEAVGRHERDRDERLNSPNCSDGIDQRHDRSSSRPSFHERSTSTARSRAVSDEASRSSRLSLEVIASSQASPAHAA